jgi:hypothetical protein
MKKYDRADLIVMWGSALTLAAVLVAAFFGYI